MPEELEKPLPESLCRWCFEEHGPECIAKKNANYALYIGIISSDSRIDYRDPKRKTRINSFLWDNWIGIKCNQPTNPEWMCGMKMRKLLHGLGEAFSYQVVAHYALKDGPNMAKEIKIHPKSLKGYEKITP